MEAEQAVDQAKVKDLAEERAMARDLALVGVAAGVQGLEEARGLD